MRPKRATIPAATDTVDNIDGWPSLIRNKLFACNSARRIRLTGSPTNFIELAALLLRSFAFSRQLLPALRGFPIYVVPFRASRYKKVRNAVQWFLFRWFLFQWFLSYPLKYGQCGQ